MNILIVDDNEALAQTLMWMLEEMDHVPHVAHTGQGAIAAARSLRPDVILIDIGLPDISGYETCRAIRAIPDLQNTVIMAQTGRDDAESRANAKEAGFQHYLVKPVRFEELDTLLASCISQKV
jgi:DNA-binding response OmpR family regulator